LPENIEDSVFIVRLTIRNDEGVFILSDGLSAEDASELGLQAGSSSSPCRLDHRGDDLGGRHPD